MKKIKPVYSPQDIPLGLSMAMAQNAMAFDVFAKLSPVQKQQLIKDSSNAHSPQEMQQLVDPFVQHIPVSKRQRLADGSRNLLCLRKNFSQIGGNIAVL